MADRPHSSLYSRSTGSVELQLVPVTHKRNRSTVTSIPDQPFVTTIDHEIRDTLGHSSAIDASASRLQILKSTRDSHLPAEERIKIRNWELSCIRRENEFYKTCTQVCRDLERDLRYISQELESEYQTRLLQHYFEPEEPIPNDEFLNKACERIDALLVNAVVQERTAAGKWKAYWEKPWV
ncbi:uncharacterized protein N7484_006752 [Penicillium longicatenatum]|uniref:uncharacterized protein n=1 Tax=Penicillium longicatenatum TaxID=1561947 RepID=UPI0025495C04|nr:uncharacterized protein N7484_006752 [Penicillium longicatenatum]KAJ5644245.1 hypothetical protein N7484_006752 [Penicillium longicatenatum]